MFHSDNGIKNSSDVMEKILVIDDEKNIRELIEDILSEEGYQIFIAQNGKEGVEFFKKFSSQIDLVILDIIMPELDGKDCYYEIKKINPQIKVILTSGYSKSNIKDELLKNGVDAYVPKPFNVGILLKAVEQVLT